MGALGALVAATLGFAVIFVLTRAALKGDLVSRPERAPQKDLRHFAAVAVAPSLFAAVALALGAPLWVCGLAALAGLPLGIQLSGFIGPWNDERVRPWVGGLMLLVPSVSLLIVAAAYRARG